MKKVSVRIVVSTILVTIAAISITFFFVIGLDKDGFYVYPRRGNLALGDVMTRQVSVCREASSHARIFSIANCGIDSCWVTYIDNEGTVLESTPELGPMSGNPEYEPITDAERCRSIDEKVLERKFPSMY